MLLLCGILSFFSYLVAFVLLSFLPFLLFWIFLLLSLFFGFAYFYFAFLDLPTFIPFYCFYMPSCPKVRLSLLCLIFPRCALLLAFLSFMQLSKILYLILCDGATTYPLHIIHINVFMENKEMKYNNVGLFTTLISKKIILV